MKNSSNGHNGVVYEFDGFRVDEARKCVWHADELVSLTPKAFETLLVLLKNPGEVVAKDLLLEQVWPETFVEESTLSQNILTLRKTLRTFEKDTQFIATVPRRGYRFVAPVVRRNGTGRSDTVHIEASEVSGDEAAPLSTVPAAARRSAYRSPLTWAAVCSLLVVSVVAAVLVLGGNGSLVDTRFRDVRTRTLLSDGAVKAAAVSPDGNYISLIERRENTERLLVRQMDEANPLEIASETDGRILNAVFSPDSRYVLYTVARHANGGRVGELFRVPILGGVRKPIVKDIDSAVSISQAGRLAFVRRRPQQGDTQLIVAESDGSAEHIVAERKEDEAFINASISPDGSRIVAAVRSKMSLERPMELVIIETTTGRQKPLTSHTWLWIGQSVWLGDGSGIAVVGYGPTSADLTDEVWFVSTRDGKARLLETGVNGVFGVSITADGRSIVAVKSDKITSFAIGSIDGEKRDDVIVTKAGDQSLLPLGADWTADGRILYSTTDNGNADIYSVDPVGGSRKRLVADERADLQPRLSPDGKYLYFLSNRSGQMSVWRGDAAGNDARKLTEGSDVFAFTVSPDGRHIYYTARADSVFSHHLWRVNSDGRNVVKLTTRHTAQPRISPDGKAILCFFTAGEIGPPTLSLLNADTGEVIRQYADRRQDIMHAWLPNGREILALSRAGSGTVLSRISVNTGEASTIREWPNENVYRLAVSPDGTRFFYEKGVSVNNVTLLSDAD